MERFRQYFEQNEVEDLEKLEHYEGIEKYEWDIEEIE